MTTFLILAVAWPLAALVNVAQRRRELARYEADVQTGLAGRTAREREKAGGREATPAGRCELKRSVRFRC